MDLKKAKAFVSDHAIYFVLVILVIGISIYNSDFMSWINFMNILIQASPRIIIAFGAAMILITAGVDLSAGKVVGLAAVVSASLAQNPEYPRLFWPDLGSLPVILPILAGILSGCVIGFINGLVIARFKITPFIATLGTMVITLGINSLYFDKAPNNSQPIGGLSSQFTAIGTGSIGSGEFALPYIVIIAVVISVLMWILFNKTVLGKNMYAIGGNPQAAIVSGISVGASLFALYVIAGALYGIGGVLEASRTGGATNNYGNMYELDAIAAAVVGGVSITGGIGTVPGVIAGVFIFTVINYGLTFIGVSPYWQLIIKGLIIVVAVGLDIRKYVAKK